MGGVNEVFNVGAQGRNTYGALNPEYYVLIFLREAAQPSSGQAKMA